MNEYDQTDIDDLLSIDIFNYLEFADPLILFPESKNFVNDILLESKYVTKGNLFNRIMSILKKCWKWIRVMMKKVIDGIKILLQGGSRGRKSLDQIASTVLGVSIAGGVAGIAGAAGVAGAIDMSVKLTQQKLGPLTDPTISNIASDVVNGDLKSAASKQLRVEYDDNNTITFNILSNAIKAATTKNGSFHGERWKEFIAVFFHCIKSPEALTPIIQFLEEVNRTHDVNTDLKPIKKIISKFMSVSLLGIRFTVTMDEWIKLHDQCNKLGTLMETWDDFNINITQNNGELDQNWIKVFNNLANISLFIQGGLNIISDSMRQSYVLDAEFQNRGNNIDILSKFVISCIDSNIPGKYIYQNTKLFADKSFNCKPDNPEIKDEKIKSLSGHGRFVMFPTNPDEIIKVAYNRYGLRSNKIEKNVYDSVSTVPEVSSQLCNIRQMSENSIIMVLDRAEVIQVPTIKAKSIQSTINEALARSGKAFQIVDINYKGFGIVKNKTVILDYGQIRRTTNNMA